MENVKLKPRYNLWQNSAYMIAAAWTSGAKSVLGILLSRKFFEIGKSPQG